MIVYQFDVNDLNIRQEFLAETFFPSISKISKNSKPLWGKMEAQHMVEHLLWSIEISTGRTAVACNVPVNMLERMKKFLYNNNPTPHNFKNPALGEEPPELRFPGIAEALQALETELMKFLEDYRKNPELIFVHPIFGEINLEEWHRSHYKHIIHHLQQYDLIEVPKRII